MLWSLVVLWLARLGLGDEIDCSLALDRGDCRRSRSQGTVSERWWFNQAANACQQFLFYGCGGNSNNFEHRGECEDFCGGASRMCTDGSMALPSPSSCDPDSLGSCPAGHYCPPSQGFCCRSQPRIPESVLRQASDTCPDGVKPLPQISCTSDTECPKGFFCPGNVGGCCFADAAQRGLQSYAVDQGQTRPRPRPSPPQTRPLPQTSPLTPPRPRPDQSQTRPRPGSAGGLTPASLLPQRSLDSPQPPPSPSPNLTEPIPVVIVRPNGVYDKATVQTFTLQKLGEGEAQLASAVSTPNYEALAKATKSSKSIRSVFNAFPTPSAYTARRFDGASTSDSSERFSVGGGPNQPLIATSQPRIAIGEDDDDYEYNTLVCPDGSQVHKGFVQCETTDECPVFNYCADYIGVCCLTLEFQMVGPSVSKPPVVTFRPSPCHRTEWECVRSASATSVLCVSLVARCNGIPDCPQGDDEIGCPPPKRSTAVGRGSSSAERCPDGSRPFATSIRCRRPSQCPAGYSCTDGLCCLQALPQSPALANGNRPKVGLCPDGTQTSTACLGGHCWNGKTCHQGFCCHLNNQNGYFDSWCPGLNSVPYLLGQSTKSCSIMVADSCPSGYQCSLARNTINLPIYICCSRPTEEVELGTCPGGLAGRSACVGFRCHEGEYCDTVTNTCCPNQNEPSVCPNYRLPIGPCFSGVCPSGHQCIKGSCCPLRAGAPGGVVVQPPSNAPAPLRCANGARSRGFCVRGACPPGFRCLGGVCCQIGGGRSLRWTGLCPSGTPGLGRCGSDGGCRGGLDCTNGVCCQRSGRAECPAGGAFLGACVQKRCLSGQYCDLSSGQCCPSLSGFGLGECPENEVPFFRSHQEPLQCDLSQPSSACPLSSLACRPAPGIALSVPVGLCCRAKPPVYEPPVFHVPDDVDEEALQQLIQSARPVDSREEPRYVDYEAPQEELQSRYGEPERPVGVLPDSYVPKPREASRDGLCPKGLVSTGPCEVESDCAHLHICVDGRCCPSCRWQETEARRRPIGAAQIPSCSRSGRLFEPRQPANCDVPGSHCFCASQYGVEIPGSKWEGGKGLIAKDCNNFRSTPGL